jgi:hypothetical protein
MRKANQVQRQLEIKNCSLFFRKKFFNKKRDVRFLFVDDTKNINLDISSRDNVAPRLVASMSSSDV